MCLNNNKEFGCDAQTKQNRTRGKRRREQKRKRERRSKE
jgi:hypothetical protein